MNANGLQEHDRDSQVNDNEACYGNTGTSNALKALTMQRKKNGYQEQSILKGELTFRVMRFELCALKSFNINLKADIDFSI